MGHSLIRTAEEFNQQQRQGKAYSTSDLLPEMFRGNRNIGNIMILIDMSERLGVEPMMLAQKLYVIKGRPAVEAQFKIAMVAKSGEWGPLKYEHSDVKTADWVCTVSATHLATGESRSRAFHWSTVIKAGWQKKTGSAWVTYPEKMMEYRAASWWIDVHCPEVCLGLATRDEVVEAEVVEVTPLEERLLESDAGGQASETGDR